MSFEIYEIVGSEYPDKEITLRIKWQSGRGGPNDFVRCHRSPCQNTNKTHKLFRVLDLTYAYCGDPDSSYNDTHYEKDEGIVCSVCYRKYLQEIRQAVKSALSKI